MDKTQKFDIQLEDIVPEYYSESSHIKKIFFDRLDRALELLEKIKPQSVLDAGCGDGLFTGMLKSRLKCPEVYGVDLNINTDELNKKYQDIVFLKADLSELKMEKKFDAITCLDVLEHFPDINPILDRYNEILKDNGYLVVSGPTESFFYRLGRLLTKGTFSQESGPGAGKHYNNIFGLEKILLKRYDLIEKKKVYFFFIHLFNVLLLKKR